MGGHLRADYCKPVYDHYVEFCGFTDEEREILQLNRKGKSNLQICMMMNLSGSSVDRRIKSIKKKIQEADRLLN